jgi:hypothetical protein
MSLSWSLALHAAADPNTNRVFARRPRFRVFARKCRRQRQSLQRSTAASTARVSRAPRIGYAAHQASQRIAACELLTPRGAHFSTNHAQRCVRGQICHEHSSVFRAQLAAAEASAAMGCTRDETQNHVDLLCIGNCQRAKTT